MNPTNTQYQRWKREGLISRYEGWSTDYFLVRLNGKKYVYQENTFAGVGVFLISFPMEVSDSDAFKMAFGQTVSSTTTYAGAVGKCDTLEAS